MFRNRKPETSKHRIGKPNDIEVRTKFGEVTAIADLHGVYGSHEYTQQLAVKIANLQRRAQYFEDLCEKLNAWIIESEKEFNYEIDAARDNGYEAGLDAGLTRCGL